MAVINSIEKRYSCRSYQSEAIEKEVMDTILEAGRVAPSAKNLQDWRFVVVTDEKTRQKLGHAANDQMFIAEAPVIIVACSESDYVMRCGQSIGPIDIAIALDHISLQAAELGVGSCWIGSFYPEKVRAILGIPENVQIIELMPLGYPADERKEPSRQPMNEIVSFEKWGF